MMPISIILVPQGAEYRSVHRGLSRVAGAKPSIVTIPVGVKPLQQYLQQWAGLKEFLNQPQPSLLLMGLCGSLNPNHCVGEVVLYQSCVYQGKMLMCDRSLTTQIHSRTTDKVPLVKALTSDRVVCSAVEKRHLGEIFGGDVVDMEGFTVLEFFQNTEVVIAMLRVISDDAHHDIPDLTKAISSDGSLQPLVLASKLLEQPVAATRLIRSSLQGLRVLEQVTTSLFSGSELTD